MSMTLEDLKAAIVALSKFKGIEARRAGALASITKTRNFKYDQEVESLLGLSDALPGLLLDDKNLCVPYQEYTDRKIAATKERLDQAEPEPETPDEPEQQNLVQQCMPSEPLPQTLSGSQLASPSAE